MDLARPQQANLLLQEGLVLGSIFHEGEVFHRDCQVTCCYACHGIGHTAKVCCCEVHCGYCAKKGHKDSACPEKEAKKRPQCINCNGAHPAWSAGCPTHQEAVLRAQRAFETRPMAFATPQNLSQTPNEATSDSDWEVVGCPKWKCRQPTTSSGKPGPTQGTIQAMMCWQSQAPALGTPDVDMSSDSEQ